MGLVFGAVIFNSHITRANDLPVIQKSGTLSTNETWVAGNVYLVSGPVTVPDTLTLTIEEGAIVKYTSYYQAKIEVKTGGTLNATGTAQDPIYFTSYQDDSVGGDSNGDGASSGDYGDYYEAITGDGGDIDITHSVIRYAGTAVEVDSGGSLQVSNTYIDTSKAFNLNYTETTVDNVDIDDADIAITVDGGQANFANTTISNSTNGLRVDDGAEVAFRGVFDNISEKAIESCNWDEDCIVDAAYVDWGSANGPLPSGQDPMACGQIAVSPWVHNSNTYNGDMFTSKNCDGSPLPTASLSSSASYFNQEVAEEQIDCDNGFQDACDAIDAAFACLGGAISVAQSQIPWPLPPATTGQEIQAFASGTASAASTYLTSEATQSVTGFSFGLLGKVAGAVSTISSMASAYSSCAP